MYLSVSKQGFWQGFDQIKCHHSTGLNTWALHGQKSVTIITGPMKPMVINDWCRTLSTNPPIGQVSIGCCRTNEPRKSRIGCFNGVMHQSLLQHQSLLHGPPPWDGWGLPGKGADNDFSIVPALQGRCPGCDFLKEGGDISAADFKSGTMTSSLFHNAGLWWMKTFSQSLRYSLGWKSVVRNDWC